MTMRLKSGRKADHLQGGSCYPGVLRQTTIRGCVQSQIKAIQKGKSTGGNTTKSRPSFPSALSSNNFLTATEQSAQNSKKGKKASEYCYSFLVDRRDVGSFITLMCKPFSPIPSFALLERW
ncbi:hypothetical protein BS47DRAFT_563017 [Hydnum rufescens UP504]|uniref:Uncharacterized protein n=1 Tax=Hydnum rufescens UP504 TaxID=1448309 RepID=A0A9P6AG36_9AGAM|nr:hypothetical protein BS47DRAFT_563017 [Hydnum rufescens UP504]